MQHGYKIHDSLYSAQLSVIRYNKILISLTDNSNRHTTTLDIHFLTTFSPMGATALGGRLGVKSGRFQSRRKGLGSILHCHFFNILSKNTGQSTTNTRNTSLLISALTFNKFR